MLSGEFTGIVWAGLQLSDICECCRAVSDALCPTVVKAPEAFLTSESWGDAVLLLAAKFNSSSLLRAFPVQANKSLFHVRRA